MNRWEQLASEIRDGTRSIEKKHVQAPLVRLFAALVRVKRCNPSAPHWIRWQQAKPRSLLSISDHADGRINRYPAVRLIGVDNFADARLSLSVAWDERSGLLQYSVALVGNDLGAKRGFYVRVDLDPEPRGQGPCSHALLHCHSGVVTDDAAHELRVPLPWLSPAEALEWVLVSVGALPEPT